MARTAKLERGPRGIAPAQAAPAAIDPPPPLQTEARPVDLFSPQTASATQAPAITASVMPIQGPAGAQSVEKSAPVGTKLAKPGFGFHMRTAEGEESVAPYRSLEDLLSAVKGVLRGAARSPEPVWFSIQPLDLATIDSEAA